MSSTYKVNEDLQEAEAMAEHLAEYVRGDELYGNAGGGFFSQHPSLTVGALLMRLRRLDALRSELKDHQSKRLDDAVDDYQSVRTEWAHHYEEKMLQEAHSRIDAMQNYFQDCADDLKKCAEYYRPELLRRTIVQEILKEMHAMNVTDEDLMRKIKQADNQLRGYTTSDDFQWHDDLQVAYPQEEFWWLYQAPQKPE